MAEARHRASQRKVSPTKLDKLIATFDGDTLAEFNEFVKHNRACSDIQTWLTERGFLDKGFPYRVGVIQRWYRNHFPVGSEAKRLNALLAAHTQISAYDSLQFGLSMAVDRLLKWKEKFDNLGEDDSEEIELNEVQLRKKRERQRLESLLPAYLRELRSIANDIENHTTIRDRDELERSGAYAVAQELLITFKDSPFEDSLKEAIRGALAKVEGR